MGQLTVRQREATYAVWRAEAGAHGGGAVAEFDGLLCWSSGVAVRHWNGVFVTAVPAQPAETLARAERWFTAREMPYGVLVPAELEPAMSPLTVAAGLHRVAEQRCMVLRPADFLQAATPAELEVHHTGTCRLEDFLTVQVEAFDSEPVTARAFLAPPVGRPGWTHLTGYRDGVPVVTAIGLQVGDVVGVYGVGTTITARRRGFGAMLTAAVVREAFSTGATLAFLNPSEMGAGMYSRLGFAEIPGFGIWLPANGPSGN